jgi:formylglycine-generating enzyme required for sulfatase activity
MTRPPPAAPAAPVLWRAADGHAYAVVPAGPFIYGPEATYERLEQAPPPRPRQALDLDAFAIGVLPVTYAGWKAFLDDTGFRWGGEWWAIDRRWRARVPFAGRRFAPVREYPPQMAGLPIVAVSQHEALAYCEWLGRRIGRRCRLPSEFEWEKAARGEEGRTYPWGEARPRPEIQWQRRFPVGVETYLFSLVVPPQREWARAGWYWRAGAPWPAGASGRNVSPYGCRDMAGNIWEWTTSLYNPNLKDYHVVKGGSWGYSIHHTRLHVRSACSVTTPSRDYRAQGTGFRVVVEV